MRDACIAGIGTAVPFPVSTDRFLEVDRLAREIHGQKPALIDLVASLTRGTGIRRRHSIHPMWLAEADRPADLPDIFTSADFDPPLWERLRFWRDHALPLAIEASKRAVANWGGNPDRITHIVTTGTSGWLEPGIACAVLAALGLPLSCEKAELNFNGCFAGATCLRIGRDLVRAEPGRVVLVVALETATGHYNVVDTDVATLVANSLFADGAAAVVLAEDGPWRYSRAGMQLVPNSHHLLTMEPPMRPQQETYRMFLHTDVARELGQWFRAGAGQAILDLLLDAPALPALAVHPGGPRILDAVEVVLRERGWPDGMLASSFETLHQYGNLGSAAILFVLADILPTLTDDRLGTFAFGPGVTVEWASLVRT
jgi:predicted naringenin-chalcone synthase